MKNVHITLVGGQPAPVYNAIKAINPDKVIYIYSASDLSRRSLEALKREIDIEYETVELDAVNPVKIQQCAKLLSDKYSQDTVTVNISSGIKSWSHFFSVEFGNRPNASIIYIDQNNTLWDYKKMQAIDSDFNFDMFTLFRLYGNAIDGHYTPFEEYTPADFDVIEKIRTLRSFNNNVFSELTEKLSPEMRDKLKQKKGVREVQKGSVEWDRNENRVKISIQHRKHDNKKVESLESPHVVDILFNTAWFELEVALLLSKWSKAKEIILNCRFPYARNVDKNEVDIIVNTGNKILFVECKTQITHSTDIDKFRSVIKAYGGLGSKGLFVTDAKMSDVNIAKCKEHDIIPFSLQDEHLFMTPDKALYMFLDSQLNSLNLK